MADGVLADCSASGNPALIPRVRHERDRGGPFDADGTSRCNAASPSRSRTGATPIGPYRKCPAWVVMSRKYHPTRPGARPLRWAQRLLQASPAADATGQLGLVDDDPPAGERYTNPRPIGAPRPDSTKHTIRDFGGGEFRRLQRAHRAAGPLPFPVAHGCTALGGRGMHHIPPHNLPDGGGP